MRLTTKFALFTSAVFISVSAFGFFPGDSIGGSSYEDCQAKLSSYIAEWSNPSSYCGGNYHCEIKQYYGPTHYSVDMIADPNIPGLRGYEKIAMATQKVLSSKKPENAKILLEGLVLRVKLTTSSSYIPGEVDELSQLDAVIQLREIIKSLDQNKIPGKGK